MRKIRIKVKYLIITIIVMLAALYIVLPNTLFVYAKSMENGDIETSKVYYKRYINLFPFSSKRAEALYNLAQEIAPQENLNSRYVIYAAGSGMSGKYNTMEALDNAAGYYREILEKYSNSEYYARAYENLAEIYTMSGRFDEVKKLIDQGLESKNEDINLIATKYQMLNFIIDKNYDEVINAGQEYTSINKGDPDMYMLMGDAEYFKGNLDSAEQYYKEARDMTTWENGKPETKLSMYYLNNVSPVERINLIDKIKNGYRGNAQVQGKVTINGKATPFAIVYLKKSDGSNYSTFGDEGMNIMALTDFNGDFVLQSLAEGDYSIGVGMPSACIENSSFQRPEEGYIHLENGQRSEYDFKFVPPVKMIKPVGPVSPVDGKVQFQWEKVDGAAYYMVNMVETPDGKNGGSYAQVSTGDKISGTETVVDINELNMKTFGFMVEDDGIPNTQAYLGIFYPGSTVPVYIGAYDKKGNLISSVPIKLDFDKMASINVSDDSITEGDRLVLEKKFEEAIKSYEKDLEKNPDDVHAMTVLSKIYSLGTKRSYIPGKEPEILGQDKKKASELCERLYEITKNYSYLKARLGYDYVDREDYEWALEQYKAIPEEYLDITDYQRIADMEVSLENFGEADKYYSKIYDLTGDAGYYNLAPVIIRIYKGEYDSALEFLGIVNLSWYMVDRQKLEENIRMLKAMDTTTGEYKDFEKALKAALLQRPDNNYRDEFKKLYGAAKDPVLSEVLKEVGNYYSLFAEY